MVCRPARRPRLPWLLPLFLLPWLHLASCPARAQQAAGGSTVSEITAESLSYDEKLKQYVAEGLVTIHQAGRTLTADRALYSPETGYAEAVGDVRLLSGRDVLTGRKLSINLNSETGLLEDGTIFLGENHLYVSGRQLRKTGPRSYSAEQASVTSCDGDHPAWHIAAQDLRVTLEGYGFARNASFWADGVPLMFTPYLAFPAKTRRQSGLLAPELGYSERRGAEYLQPFYWAINDSSDATFYEHYMSLRGFRHGLEYRYVLDPRSMGAFMLDYLDDRKVDNGLDHNSEKYGYPGDNALRPNHDRYWLRAKANQDLPWDMTAQLDLDIVSDQDYLTEFRSVLNGFTYSRDYYVNTFGRDLDDYNDPVRLNRLNINRLWPYYALNASVLWNDDVLKRRQGERDDTLQRLPLISFNGLKQPLTPSIYYDLNSSFVDFYREDGTRGQRLDVHPRAYYLYSFLGGVTVEPSVGLRQTAWLVQRDEETAPSGDSSSYYRAMYDFRLATAADLFRVYDFRLAGFDRFKHTMVPEIVYSYIPEQDQSDIPVFDSLDHIEPENLITYSLNNFLSGRRPRIGPAAGPGPAYDYFSIMRFTLSQSFDINRSNRGERPFSDVMAELILTPGQYVAVDTEAAWSPYTGRFDTYNLQLSLWDPRGDLLSVDYRNSHERHDLETLEQLDQQEVESIRAATRVVLNSRWNARAVYEHNIETNTTIETSLGITYKAQCWAVDFDIVDEADNYGFRFLVHLLGLGVLGG